MEGLTELVPPTQIDAHTMERDLSQLMHKADGNKDHPLSRISTLNLVVVAPSHDDANALSETVRAQAMRHPNRTIILSPSPNGAEASPEVWARVDADTVSNQTRIIFEGITIATGSVDQLVSMVLPLLLPDLPVVLWWPDHAPFTSPLFTRLEQYVDRVLVDTGSFESPANDLMELATFLGRGYAISDLNWDRLTPWRELAAQFFDTRSLLPHLRRLDRVTIGYEAENGKATNLPQALLLAGWLSSQLGWTPLDGGVSVEGDLIRIHLRRPALGIGPNAMRLVMIELRAAPVVNDSLDCLASLSLQATDNILASFTVQRADDPNWASTAVDVADMPSMSRTVRIESLSPAQLLSQELRLLSTDTTYGAALRIASRFAQELR